MAVYTVDERDRVIQLDDVPQCSTGAPCPVVLAAESRVAVAYFLQNVPAGWDGSYARMVGPNSPDQLSAVVTFTSVKASMFGPPNDEAFAGHPLASRGLQPYGAFEVLDSSWLRRLEKMNRVHPGHRPEYFSNYRHIVLSFHDSTFECVAATYSYELTRGPLTEVVGRAVSGIVTD